MKSPIAPAAGTRRTFASAASAAGLIVILLVAAYRRFLWPQWPSADSDTWGYLNPALSALCGEGFQHTYGRNFIYPGWIYALLAATGDFRAIPIAQHILGLSSGLLLWWAWQRGREWFTDARLPQWTQAAIGLALVAFFECSASVQQYEHQIRPEAMFPFFSILDLGLLLEFLHAWYVARNSGRAAVFGGLSLFVSALLYQLKPSFGLSTLFVAAPLAIAALRPWLQPWRPRFMLVAAAAAAGLAAALLLWLPERILSRNDPMSVTFLPDTLLTVHAELIRDQMGQDLRDHRPAPWPDAQLAAWHDALVREVGRAAEPAQRPYKVLGFNPDHLMYAGDSFCHMLHEQLTPAQVAAFGYYWYGRAWEGRPVAMIAKVCRQMYIFYSLHCPAFWPTKRSRLNSIYGDTCDAFVYASYQAEMAKCPPARAYLAAARQLSQSGTVYYQPLAMILTNIAASVCYTPLFCLFGIGMATVAWAQWRRPSAPSPKLLAPGMVILMFYSFNLGNCLTIGIVHSLDIDRYSKNQLIFSALAMFAAVGWLAELGLYYIGVRGRRAARPCPADPAVAQCVVSVPPLRG